MDSRRLFAEVMAEAGKLGLTRWERLLLIVAVALLIVTGRRGFEALKNIKIEPQIVVDENGPQPDGTALPTGEPGGGDTGGMG